MWRYFSYVDMEINIQSTSQQNSISNPVCLLVSKVIIYLLSLHALITLCMAYSYKFMSDEENEILISRVLSKINVFADVEYAPKVLITAFTEMLLLYEVPFVNRRFTQLLDLTVSMLEVTSKKKSVYMAKEEDDDEV